MIKKCDICGEPISVYAKYCRHCLRHIPPNESAACARALKAAWNPILKAFICFYTGVVLEENDFSSPWYMTFDHRIPGKKGDLVVCARWVNNMKATLSDTELKAVIIEFDRSKKAKEPFNMAVAEFKYWKGPADQKPRKRPVETYHPGPEVLECIVCSRKTIPHSWYCPICRVIAWKCARPTERVAPMKASWDKVRQCFICYLTGLEVELKDRKSPRYITFDHRIPRMPGTLAVAVAFANIMKTALSDDEFWLIVGELANHFRTGKPFNRDIIKFAYWKRPRMARKARK